jgi:hypothetical protein
MWHHSSFICLLPPEYLLTFTTEVPMATPVVVAVVEDTVVAEEVCLIYPCNCSLESPLIFLKGGGGGNVNGYSGGGYGGGGGGGYGGGGGDRMSNLGAGLQKQNWGKSSIFEPLVCKVLTALCRHEHLT